MRFIVFGVGAIGGTLAAALSLAGREVVGIARGGMLEAIRQDGLHFRSPSGDHRVRFSCHADPDAIDWREDDVILLTMKSQDTGPALEALAAAGLGSQAIVCAQNGVANERLALRFFPNVYGATVMLPADYTTPGEVICFGTPKFGMFDLGRYPAGIDRTAERIADALRQANCAVELIDEVMRSKHGKLLENLANVVEAALGPGSDGASAIVSRARAEAETVLRAAGITGWLDIGSGDPRRHGVLEMGNVPGVGRAGGSSTQSLKRGAGSIETDYLNGEIVLLARLHGVPAPVNAGLCAIGRRLVAERLEPGALTPADLEAATAA